MENSDFAEVRGFSLFATSDCIFSVLPRERCPRVVSAEVCRAAFLDFG